MRAVASLDDFRRANEAAGHHWFSPGAMRFFRTRLGDTVYGDRYFISSEQPPDGVRRFSIREAVDGGRSVRTVGEFCGYATRYQAEAAVKRLLKAEQDA